jgi:hypothetical protein
MHFNLRILLVLAAAAAVAALTAAAAIGGNTKAFDSRVTLSPNNPFHGHVTSEKHACVAHRVVKVFNARAGANGLYGKTETDRDGDWSLSATPNGDFYAKVARREEGTAGTIYVCRSDWSPTRHFE